MTNKQEELYASQLDASNENTHKEHSSQIREVRTQGLEPFAIVGNDEDGWKIVFGRLRLTFEPLTYEDARRKIETRDWELMVNVILGIVDAYTMYAKQPETMEENMENTIGAVKVTVKE